MRNPQTALGRLLYVLLAPWRWTVAFVRTFVIAPYYDVREALHGFRMWIVRTTGAQGLGGVLLYYLLWVPRTLLWLIVESCRRIWWGLTAWPRFVRLRDLAAGLPALLVASAAVPLMTVVHPDGNTMLADYQKQMQEAHISASEESDPIARENEIDRALFFARCLSLLRPADKAFQFSLAMLYGAKGDDVRSRSLMAELAPRNTVGYGPAHFWHGKQLLMRPLNSEDFQAAVAHFDYALRSTEVDRNEVHRELGRLYYQAYLSVEAGGQNPLVLSREKLLENAKSHFLEYKGPDSQPTLLLGHILAKQGNVEQAQLSVGNLIAGLRTKLSVNPADVETRLELARAHAAVLELREASDVIQEGRILNPDPRYDRELSNIYYAQSLEYQRTLPSARQMPYQALRAAIEAWPGNGLVVAKLLQSLLDKNKASEAELARKTLTDLPVKLRDHGVVQFLLGIDADRRALPQIAERHYAAARNSSDGIAPAVIADVANAVMERKFSGLSSATGAQLCETAMRIWPTHPDLLYLRGKQNFQARRYAEALSDLNKAVAAKKNDATLALRLADEVRLNAMLASAYLNSGQRENAERHQKAAQAAAALNIRP